LEADGGRVIGRHRARYPHDVAGRRDCKTITRQNALDIAVRAALSQAEQWRILALPYPVEYRVFWQVLADMGVTQERLMDRTGASP
jgi:hypothetical protein